MRQASVIFARGAALIIAAALWGWLPARTARGASKPATWGQILIIGVEWTGHSAVEIFDPATSRFAPHPPSMHRGRTGATATVIVVGREAGKVLVAGGFNARYGPLASTELYDPADDRFTRGPEMTTDRDYAPAIVVPSGSKAGSILFTNYRTADLYDPTTNHFTVGPTTIRDSFDQTATVIPVGPNAGKILFAGGKEDPPVKFTQLYDPASNTFVRGPGMNTRREGHTATVLTAGPNAGRILLVGGWLERDFNGDWSDEDQWKPVPLASTELYDPATNTFASPSATPTLNVARGSHTATVLTVGPNAGKLLIVGGQQNERTTLSSTELYDPFTNRFILGPPLHEARTQHVAMVIPSGPEAGKLLIAGGVVTDPSNPEVCGACKFDPPLASTELYDPATNSFAPGPRMHGAPGDVIAVQLPPAQPHR